MAPATARARGGGRDRDLARFLAEDSAGRDITGALVPNEGASARIACAEAGPAIVAGAAHAGRVFAMRGCSWRALVGDGGEARRGDAVLSVRGPARAVLACERTALNLLSRMSGIATATGRIVSALEGTGVGVLATRKTAPGLRRFDKEAVEAGGGGRHRMSLGDAVVVKDNHVAAGGPVGALVEAAVRRRAARRGRWEIEAEADTVREAVEAARAGADAVMLDNFTPRGAARAVAALESAGLRGAVRVEASGGITEASAPRYAAAGVDSVSVGALTHSVRAVDYTLEIEPRRGAGSRIGAAAGNAARRSRSAARSPRRR